MISEITLVYSVQLSTFDLMLCQFCDEKFKKYNPTKQIGHFILQIVIHSHYTIQ